MVHAEQREDDRQRHRHGHELQDKQSAQHFSALLPWVKTGARDTSVRLISR